MKYPITPPPKLVYDWAKDRVLLNDPTPLPEYIATRAAQWGADQELEACCEWLEKKGFAFVDEIRTARRPKPPSLKEQALRDLTTAYNADKIDDTTFENILRALEQLND